MSVSLRVAILDEELPFPADSGKRLRTMNLLTRLAGRHEITFITYRSADEAAMQQAGEFWRNNNVNVEWLDDCLPSKSGPLFYARLAANLFSPLPYSVQTHNRPSLRRYVRSHTGISCYDLWHCEWTPYAESCLGVVREPWLVMAHNVESLIWRRMYETAPPSLKRWYIGHQWRKYDRFEKRAYSQAPLLVTVSDEDARLAERDYGATNVQVVDNGVDPVFFHPNPAFADDPHAERVPHRLLFLGSLDWRPNIDAAELLLDTVFPLIRQQVPEAELQIVGRRPSQALRDRIAATPGVTLHSDVPDVRPFLWQCGMMIVPLRIGGGSRLKILEALATACPVVSTAVGAEGLRLRPDREILIADTPEALAESAVLAIRHPETPRRLADAGRAVVCREYGWDALAEKLETVWIQAATVNEQRQTDRYREVAH